MHVCKILNSKRDKAGNVYSAFEYIADPDIKVCGTISGGGSNIEAALREMWGGWEEKNKNVFVAHETLKIREFNRIVKGWRYAGCHPANIAAFIQDNIK